MFTLAAKLNALLKHLQTQQKQTGAWQLIVLCLPFASARARFQDLRGSSGSCPVQKNGNIVKNAGKSFGSDALTGSNSLKVDSVADLLRDAKGWTYPWSTRWLHRQQILPMNGTRTCCSKTCWSSFSKPYPTLSPNCTFLPTAKRNRSNFKSKTVILLTDCLNYREMDKERDRAYFELISKDAVCVARCRPRNRSHENRDSSQKPN